jgi:4,5-DOPA dioxygenase extradiol
VKRRDLLKSVLAILSAHSVASPTWANHATESMMPVLFVGHGSPMNVLRDTAFTQHLGKLGATLPKPRAILVISAHWVEHHPTLMTSAKPSTIYDFGGFPKELYQVQYGCEGDPVLANNIANRLNRFQSHIDSNRGLDHGAWSVLHHLYPEANIPVIQLAMGAKLSMKEHLEIGVDLQKLRKEGVLILASGNIVHNLNRLDMSNMPTTPSWAEDFDETIKSALLQKDLTQLLALDKSKHPLWQMSHPTLEHYVPLLYTVGASLKEGEITFPYEGFEEGSLSMRSVLFS